MSGETVYYVTARRDAAAVSFRVRLLCIPVVCVGCGQRFLATRVDYEFAERQAQARGDALATLCLSCAGKKISGALSRGESVRGTQLLSSEMLAAMRGEAAENN